MDKETLYKFFDRQASAEEKDTIKQWLRDSPENEEELYRERQFFGAMILNGQFQKESIPKEVKASKKQVPVYHWFIREAFKVAAVIAITLGVGFYFLQIAELGVEAPMLSITVPAGQRANLVLPDGTSVWLNARTELKYPGVFTGANREIELDGEAYFEVKADKEKPFIVHTHKYDIEVLGTKFNVEAYSDSEDFVTALMEGSVRVTDKSEKTNTLVLQPNYLTILRDGSLVAENITDPDYYRWREGLVCFREMDFVQLMRRFEKCYGIRIEINNPRLSEYAFTGKFRVSDGIDNALRVLQKDAPYTIAKNEEENVIYINK